VRVLFVIHTPKDACSAVFAQVGERVEYLCACGDQAGVLGPEDFALLRRRGTRWRLLCLPVVVAAWLWRRRRQWDVVVFHSYSGWLFNLLRRRTAGWPHVVTQFHGLEPLAYAAARRQATRVGDPLSTRYRFVHGTLMPLALRWSCRKSDAVFCLNSAEREYLQAHGWAPSQRVSIVSNSFPSRFFVDRRRRDRASRLLFVGQWAEVKGIRYLAEAFALLAERFPDLKLWCVGTRVPAEKVRASFPRVVARRVFVRPTVPRSGVPAYLRAADVFVFPSLYEGASVALLEACAAGLPIVTTPVGAASSYLTDGESAVFVPPADSTALYAAVERVLLSADMRTRLTRAATEAAKPYESKAVSCRFLRELIATADI
jgi:glycosyltransferase involved in cell wall biosynthesis